MAENFISKSIFREYDIRGIVDETLFQNCAYLIGKGLGGDYYVAQGGIVETINNKNQAISRVLHIGATYSILKGGIFLFLIIFLHIFRTIYYNLRRVKYLNERELTCLCFLLVYSIFRLIEGPISPGAIFDATLYGMSLGVLNLNWIKK